MSYEEQSAEDESAGHQIRAVEEWATEKGMLPLMNGTRENPEAFRFLAAKGLRNWPVGKEVAEAEFDAAVTEAVAQAHH